MIYILKLKDAISDYKSLLEPHNFDYNNLE
jgi:hypothetical protein